MSTGRSDCLAVIPDRRGHSKTDHCRAASQQRKYLSRSGSITTLEGAKSTANFVALIEFPNAESLQAFIKDPNYAPYAKARQEGTDSRFIASDDTDAAGSIPYLTAGNWHQATGVPFLCRNINEACSRGR